MKPHTGYLISISYTFKYTCEIVAKSVDSFLLHNSFFKKSKSSLCTRHQSVWRNGGVASFIKRSVSRPGRFTSEGTDHCTNWKGGRVRPTAGLETAGKKHLPLPGFISRLYGCPSHSRSILRGSLALVSAKRRIHCHGAEYIRRTKAYKFSWWNFKLKRLKRRAKDLADIQNIVHETGQDGSPHTISGRGHLKMKSVDRQALLIPLCLSRRFWGPIAPIRATDSAGMTCSSRPTAIFLYCTFTSQNNAEADNISDTPAMKQVSTHWKSPQHKSSFVEEPNCCRIRWPESEADHLPISEVPRVLRMHGSMLPLRHTSLWRGT